MKKKQQLLSAILVLIGTCAANAQHAYTYVQQDGVKIDDLGTAAFLLTSNAPATLEFDQNRNAVMTIGSNTVARLPMSDKGQLVVDFETTSATTFNKVSKTVSSSGYATLYSPFQLTVPVSGNVETYVPTYDATNHVLKCNSTTKVAPGTVIPVETAPLLKNAGTIEFSISAGPSTDTHTSALSGSSLTIKIPRVDTGNTLYTLGHESENASNYGFFKYTGSLLKPGRAWLVAASIPSSARYIPFSFDDDELTAILDLNTIDSAGSTTKNSMHNGRKVIENDRIVILRNGKKYNLNGQEMK